MENGASERYTSISVSSVIGMKSVKYAADVEQRMHIQTGRRARAHTHNDDEREATTRKLSNT